MASMTPLINTLIHVIMYSYYFMSANASPQFKAKLNKWKMWLTVVQMVRIVLDTLINHNLSIVYSYLHNIHMISSSWNISC